MSHGTYFKGCHRKQVKVVSDVSQDKIGDMGRINEMPKANCDDTF